MLLQIKAVAANYVTGKYAHALTGRGGLSTVRVKDRPARTPNVVFVVEQGPRRGRGW